MKARRLTLTLLSALISTAFPSVAQEPDTATEGLEERSGFWLRGNFGFGYGNFSSDDAEFSGGAGIGAISIGIFQGDKLGPQVQIIGHAVQFEKPGDLVFLDQIADEGSRTPVSSVRVYLKIRVGVEQFVQGQPTMSGEPRNIPLVEGLQVVEIKLAHFDGHGAVQKYVALG